MKNKIKQMTAALSAVAMCIAVIPAVEVSANALFVSYDNIAAISTASEITSDGSVTKWEGEIVLSSDVVISGDLLLDSFEVKENGVTVTKYFESLDLNGHTLTVYGNVTHHRGEILFHNGKIKIGGNYLNATPDIDSGQKAFYNTSSGTLKMVWDDDYMLVGGNFITNAFPYQSTLSTGTIEIKGNVQDYSDGNCMWNASDTNKVILSGTGNQIVHMKSRYAHFNDLEVQNANKRTINLTNEFQAENVIVDGDITIKSDNANAVISGMTLKNGTSVTFTGNLNDVADIDNIALSSDISSIVSVNKNTIKAGSSGDAVVSISGSEQKINVTVEGSTQIGDVNEDGKISVADIILLQKYLHNKQKFTKAQFEIADMNSDGNVNVFDLVFLKRKLLQK